MIIIDENELKLYLKKKTGYEVVAIYSVENYTLKDFPKTGLTINKKTFEVTAYCNAMETLAFLNLFLWGETINTKDYIKFIRSKKLHQINKSTN